MPKERAHSGTVLLFLHLSQCFHFVGSQRYLLAQASGAGFGYQIILFVTDAAEVFVSLHLIIIDEVSKLVLATPQVYQFGDEIDARLYGVYESRFQGDGQAQALAAELGAFLLSVVADLSWLMTMGIIIKWCFYYVKFIRCIVLGCKITIV